MLIDNMISNVSTNIFFIAISFAFEFRSGIKGLQTKPVSDQLLPAYKFPN